MEPTILYKKAKKQPKNGNLKVQKWACWVIPPYSGDPEREFPCIVRESGQIDGKMTVKKKFVKKGKNIGKSNETTPYEQACFEARNEIKGKIEDNMVDALSKIDSPPKYLYPALASKHDEKKTLKLLKERGYLYAQPKLNGARCWKLNHLGFGHPHDGVPSTADMISRQLKIFTEIDHINQACDMFGKYSPDGEVFNKDFDFQTIISLLKKKYERGENPDYPEFATTDLEYHVYDLAIPDKTYEERKAILDSLFKQLYNQPFFTPEDCIIQPVETIRVESLEEIDELNAHYISLGYEGLILRDPESPYAFNDRNLSLIKYKKFYDDEFEIVGHEVEIWDDTLSNKMRNLVIWVCRTSSGFVFRSRPKGSFLERERLFWIAEQQYGKKLTVRYQELSQDGVPIMNIGIGAPLESEGIRDYE